MIEIDNKSNKGLSDAILDAWRAAYRAFGGNFGTEGSGRWEYNSHGEQFLVKYAGGMLPATIVSMGGILYASYPDRKEALSTETLIRIATDLTAAIQAHAINDFSAHAEGSIKRLKALAKALA